MASESMSPATRGGRVTGRGHGRGRGRGRGAQPRGKLQGSDHTTVTSAPAEKNATQPPSNRVQKKLQLTHFLSLPLGHHPALRTKIEMFTNGLLRSNPPIEGLHESIVINSRRLHLTLGVMAFSDNATLNPSTSPSGSAVPARQTTSRPKSLAVAQALLASLRPHIRALLNSDSDSSSPANPVRDGAARREIEDGSARSRKLKLKLNRMDIMKPERAPHRLRSDADEQEQGAEGEGVYGRVLWVGPDTSNINVEGGVDGDADTRRLHGVCTFINRQFMDAGLVMDERRPLKLHCTIANTIYRKPRPKSHAHNLPFSYSAILASPAFKTISTSRNRDVSDSQHQQQACLNRSERVVIPDGQMGQVNIDKGKGNESKPKERARGRGVPVPVDLGVWEVGEVQICEMGSHGPEGEYVCVARCEF